MVATITRHRFNVDEYYRMADIGILHEDSRVELLQGVIYEKYPADGGEPRPYRFSVSEYELMGLAGILREDERVELVAGEVIEMSPVGARHMRCVDRLTRLLARTVPDEFLVHVQNPIQLPYGSEPLPDLAVIHDRDYLTTPTVADTLLVIEVADSSLAYDRREKMPMYATARIPEAWLVDLLSGTLERYTDPHPGGYRQVTQARPGEELVSTTAPSLRIPVAAILR